MSGLQAPQLLTDVYRDLQDRRLLALAAVLLAAIVVVPVALSSSPSGTASTGAALPSPGARKAPSALRVIAPELGLRDYRRRLKEGGPRNPFDQQYTAPAGLPPADFGQPSSGGGATTSGGGGTTAVSPTSASTTTAPASIPPSLPVGGGSAPQTVTETTTKTRYVSYRIDVRTGLTGQTLDPRNEVENLTPLPSESVPALTFIGVSMDSALNAKKASFLVSSSVSASAGEGKCILGSPQCQLLTLKPGQYEDLVWADGLTYRVTLLRFEPIARDRLPSLSSQRPKRSNRA